MMKKIFALVVLLVLGKISYSQYPLVQNLGSDSTIVVSKGALQSRLIPTVITDTNAANAQRLKSYPGAQLYTTNGNFYIRNSNATKWVLVSSGSIGPVNIYNSDGTLTGNRTLTGANYNLTFNGLNKFSVTAGDTVLFNTPKFNVRNLFGDLVVEGTASGGAASSSLTIKTASDGDWSVKTGTVGFDVGDLRFYDNINGGGNARVIFKNTGKVGIGTESPDSLLTVNGGLYVGRGIRAPGLPTAPGTKALRINAQGQLSIADTTAAAGTGTVTSVATNNGSGITGGTITTTGTLAIDTTIISTKANVSGGLAGKLNISDTSDMLKNYVNSAGYGLGKSSQSLYADTATLSNTYLRRKDSLTATNSLGYVTKTVLADTASAIRGALTGGTVTSVATNNGTGITGGTITSTGTLAIDTLLISTRAWRQKGIDSVASLPKVTSVGLTMPVAFAVAGSPVTSSGTLAVTGAGLASQYIRGDGTLANFPGGGGGGGSSVSYYLNGGVNQGTFVGNTYYQLSKIANTGTAADFTIAADGYITQFITDAGDPALLNIPAGNWNFEMYFSASSGGGSPSFYVELYKYNGTAFTLIASSSGSPEGITNGTAIDLYTTALTVPATSLTLTDRLAIRVYVTHSGRTITLHTQDNTLCQVITTFTTGITALNSLTAQVQYLTTGTSGTDFNISSLTDTHTFNLPVASATNTGKLSSTDWSTFNAKISPADTASMLSPYLNNVGYGLAKTGQVVRADSATLSNYYLRRKDSLTSTNLLGYVTRTVLADTAAAIRGADAGGTVKSVATNNGTGITGGTITTTGTLAIDTLLISTRAWRQKGIDSITTFYVPYTGATSDLNMGLKNIYAQNVSSTNYVTGSTMSSITRSDATATAYGQLYLKRSANGYLQPASLSLDRTWTLPDNDGTIALTSDLTGGTVTSVATNTNTGITGGTITTSGTIAADTLLLSTRKWRQKGIDSVQGNLTTGLALKVNISDTASMLSPYLRSNVASATYVPQTRTITINGTSQDLSANRTYNVGTVTSVATSTGTGITGGTITSSGTLAIDTLLLSTRAWRQKGVDSVAALVSGAVSGTTNYIPKFTSSSAIGNSVIYEASGSVGIGTTSPNTYGKFAIANSGTVEGYSVNTATTGQASWWSQNNLGTKTGIFQYGSSQSSYGALGSGEGALYSNGTFTLMADAVGSSIKFAVNGNSEQMRLTSTGLGIGTSSPAYKLDVNGDINIVDGSALRGGGQIIARRTGNEIRYGSGTAADYLVFYSGAAERMRLDASGNLGLGVSPTNTSNYIKLQISGTTGGILDLLTGSTRHFTIYNSSSNTVLGTVSNTPLIFQTNDGTKMTLDASGNLGLGVTPSAWLSTNRAFQLGYGAVRSFTNSANTYLDNNNYVNTSGSDIYLNNGAAGRYRIADEQHIWYQAASGTAGNAISFTQAMTLDASGNLKVGTTGGTSKLNVTGITNEYAADFQASSTTSQSYGVIIRGGTNSNDRTFHVLNAASSSTYMLIRGDGNVGIGTTSPNRLLTIKNSADAVNGLSFQNYSSTAEVGYIRYDQGTDILDIVNTSAYSSGGIKFSTNSTERMRITSGGNVGIGTSSPNIGTWNQALTLNTASGNAAYELAVGGSAQLYLAADNSNAYLQVANTTSPLRVYTGGSERMRITSGGNVGIGTTSPGARLVISNSGALGYEIDPASSSGTEVSLFSYNRSTSAWKTTRYSALDHRFEINGVTEAMRITSGGNVGIGTTSPSNKLVISNGGAYGFEFDPAGSTLLTYNRSTSAYATFAVNALDYQFYTSASERMRITSSGELLVNTTTDAGDYKLQVNGDAIINKSSGTPLLWLNTTTAYAASGIITQESGTNKWAFGANFGSGDDTWNIYNYASANRFLTINTSGNTELYGSIKTAAPSGGTAKPYKWGEAGVAIGGSNGYAVKVEIDGTVYYLMTGYLPEPAPESASGPSSAYQAKFEEPSVKTSPNTQKIKELEAEVAELKAMMKVLMNQKKK